MLSTFPELFDWSAAAVSVLRIVIALFFIVEGYRKYPRNNTTQKPLLDVAPKNFKCKCVLAAIEMIFGSLLFIGLQMQIAAIVLFAASLKRAWNSFRYKPRGMRNLSYYLLISAVVISFIFLGPGDFAIDLPM